MSQRSGQTNPPEMMEMESEFPIENGGDRQGGVLLFKLIRSGKNTLAV